MVVVVVVVACARSCHAKWQLQHTHHSMVRLHVQVAQHISLHRVGVPQLRHNLIVRTRLLYPQGALSA